MDKESGVYLTITDNSFQTGGLSNLKVVIPMLTTKGKIGLNDVNANNFKSILGYDLKYNSNYEGLSRILESLSHAQVWRINQGAKLANAYFVSTASDKESLDDAETFEDVTQLDPKPILALSLKDIGDPQTTAIRFEPTPSVETVSNEFATPSTPQEIVFDDISSTEKTIYNGTEIQAGCVFYNSSNNAIVGIIKPNYEDVLQVYKVVDGEIVDDVISTIVINTWTDGTTFYGSDMTEMEEPEGEAGTPVELGSVRESTWNKTNEIWTLGDKFLTSDTGITTEPAGTAGASVSLGEGCIAGSGSEHIVPGKLYITNDVGTTFYVVTTLTDDFDTVVKNEIVDPDAITELSAMYTGSEFENLNYVPYEETVNTGFYQKKMDSWFKALSFSSSMIVLQTTAETNPSIIAALEAASDITISFNTYSREVLTEDNSCGTAVWDEEKLTVNLVKTVSKDSFWNVRTIPSVIVDWTLIEAFYADNQYTVQNTYNFSTNTDSEIFWKKLDFGDINLFIQDSIPSNWEAVRSYFTLDNGSNGRNDIVASEIDVNVLETCGCNVLAMNGITNYKILNRIAIKAETLFIHTFGDAPAYSAYADLEQWAKNVYRSNYLAIGARPDQVEISKDEYIYVYPSVNYVSILARMLSQYQCLNYPPAGFTYGTIAVENLIVCDYDHYGDELKTNRINWQRTKNQGSVMWEQRTTYGLDTDLSYIAPNFIIDGLREEIVDFEENFNFRYTSPTDLLNQESGLKGILDNYVTRGFVYRYELDVPSYTEAQEAGRVLTINIGVAITKDSEVIYININLNNG